MPDFPSSVAAVVVDEDVAYVVDVIGCRVWVLDGSLKFVDSFGKRGRKKGEFFYPSSVALRDGHMYIADSFNNRIQILDRDFSVLGVYGKAGVRRGSLTVPIDVMFDGDSTFVLERDNNRIQVFSREWESLWMFGGVYKPPRDSIATYLGPIEEYKDGYGFLYPVRFIRGRNGDVFVVNSGNDRLLRLDGKWCKIDDTVISSYPYSVAFVPSGYILVAPWRGNFVDVYTEDFVFVRRTVLEGVEIESIARGFSGGLLVFDVRNKSVFEISLDLPDLEEFYRVYRESPSVDVDRLAVIVSRGGSLSSGGCDWLYERVSAGKGDAAAVVLKVGCSSPEWCGLLSSVYLDELRDFKDFVYGYRSALEEWMVQLMAVNDEEEEIRKVPHERIDIDLGKVWYEIRQRLAPHKEVVMALCKAYGESSLLFGASSEAVGILLDILRLYSDTFVKEMDDKDKTVFYRWYFRRLLEKLVPHVIWEIEKVLEISDDEETVYDELRAFLSSNVIVSSGKNEELRRLFDRLQLSHAGGELSPKEVSDELDVLFGRIKEVVEKGQRERSLNDRLDVYAYLSVDWAKFLSMYNRFWWFGGSGGDLVTETVLLRNLLRKRSSLSRTGSYFHRTATRWDVDLCRDYLAAVISLEFLRVVNVVKEGLTGVNGVGDLVDFAMGVASFHKDASFFKGFEYVDLDFISELSGLLQEVIRGDVGSLLSSFSSAVFPIFSSVLEERNKLLLDESPNLDSAISRLDSLCMLFNGWSKLLISLGVSPEADVLEKILKEGWDLGRDYALYLSASGKGIPLPDVALREKDCSVFEEVVYEFDVRKLLNLWRELWEGKLNRDVLRRFVEKVQREREFELKKRKEGVPVIELFDPRLVAFAEVLGSIVEGA